MKWFESVLVLHLFLQFTVLLAIGVDDANFLIDNRDFFTPAYLFDCTKMNWVGCFVTSLVIILLFPIYCIPATLFFVVYWLFHIGRKE